jgi:hypothetical protein
MKILKGEFLSVIDTRKGNFDAIAIEDFDTEKEEFYPIAVDQKKPIEGMANTWQKGEKIPARRGISKIIRRGNKQEKILLSDFGRDHWSLLAYCETVCVDRKGILEYERMTCNTTRHPTKSGNFPFGGRPQWKDEYGTRTKNGIIGWHDDFDCLDELEEYGFLTIDYKKKKVKLTELGLRTAGAIRMHKANSGTFSTFEFEKKVKS